jgi:hypothetical protein
MRNTNESLVGKPEGNVDFEDAVIDERITERYLKETV